MTRDYKPAARNRRSPASGSGSSLLVGILIGLLLGLGIALAVAIYLNKIPGAFLSRSKPSEPSAPVKPDPGKAAPKEKTRDLSAKAEDKPRFDFYSILPGADEGAKGKPAVEPPPPAAAEAKEIFYLQAGAFQGLADADNMKARLALLGIEATIQTHASPERGPLHRVRIGPYSRVDEVNRARETLKQNGIESTLIKGRETAN
ncbi:MAG: SPOR domain-containing protein [Burkholderiales bacterium]|nr:SPOR domain-containing protein [Burkholderiales bacterium]